MSLKLNMNVIKAYINLMQYNLLCLWISQNKSLTVRLTQLYHCFCSTDSKRFVGKNHYLQIWKEKCELLSCMLNICYVLVCLRGEQQQNRYFGSDNALKM